MPLMEFFFMPEQTNKQANIVSSPYVYTAYKNPDEISIYGLRFNCVFIARKRGNRS